jgi:hypothetical protein
MLFFIRIHRLKVEEITQPFLVSWNNCSTILSLLLIGLCVYNNLVGNETERGIRLLMMHLPEVPKNQVFLNNASTCDTNVYLPTQRPHLSSSRHHTARRQVNKPGRAVNSRGAIFVMMIGSPLGSGGYSGSSWPGDCRILSLTPSFHHSTLSFSPTDRRYL